MPVKTGEILFLKCVKCGIPNRDPLRDSDARRLFGEEDGRISLTDVSIKRDVRDYVVDRFPDGGEAKDRFVFVQKKFNSDGSALLGRDGLAQEILRQVRPSQPAVVPPAVVPPAVVPPAATAAAPPTRGTRRPRAPRQAGGAQDEKALMAAAFDMRVFGAVFSVEGKSFNQTGPVQFGWAHSLHPAETKYTQGTVVMPSKDAPVGQTKEDEEGGKTQGTIWTQYQLPFAVFAMPGVINASIANRSGMTEADMDLVLAGLWRGTHHRQARGRGIQQPLLLLHLEYTDPFFRLGFLEEGIKLEPGRDVWKGGSPPTDLATVSLDVKALAERLTANKSRIARARLWHDPLLKLSGSVPSEPGVWPEGV